MGTVPTDAMRDAGAAGRADRLAEILRRRGLEVRTLELGPGHEPERMLESSRGQRSLVAHAKGYPSTGTDRCAAWVEGVFDWSGIGREGGSARDLYERYCFLSDAAELRVGMIVAVPAHPYSVAGTREGHVGIHVGDGLVMDCVETGVRTVPLQLWYMAYGVLAEPRWGWMRGVALG